MNSLEGRMRTTDYRPLRRWPSREHNKPEFLALWAACAHASRRGAGRGPDSRFAKTRGQEKDSVLTKIAEAGRPQRGQHDFVMAPACRARLTFVGHQSQPQAGKKSVSFRAQPSLQVSDCSCRPATAARGLDLALVDSLATALAETIPSVASLLKTPLSRTA